MKIVHIITRMILGGAQENTLFTCEGLHERGHEVTLITGPTYGPEGGLLERAKAGGYEVIEVESLRRAINPFHDVPCYYRLKELIKELEPDIVHTHSAKAGILGRWAAEAVRKGRGEACCAPLRALREAHAAQCRRPIIIHTIHGLAFHPYLPGWKNRLYIAAEKSAAKCTDYFITVAQAMTDQALAAGIGREDRYCRIFSGIEVADFANEPGNAATAETRRELDIPEDAVVAVCVARLAEFKGHEDLIRAAKELGERYPKLMWMFVGDGYLRKELEKQIAEAGLTERFRLTGLVGPSEVPKYLHASDLLVHCSLREGLARVLPQAFLCGKPVVSYDVDGAREVVNEQTGFLIEPRDEGALCEAVAKLVESRELREKLGKAGQVYCQEHFDHRLMVDQIEELYKRLL